ncbi:DUF7011 domain-containing protein, partial [Escherichia coli]|uniref:DUF7011 domain-containing protein n=1 Tax=Escherichia coli TaxID=562 RepID=UPI003F519FAE
MVQVYPDADPPPDAHAFEFWRVPGRKQLIHDGKRLVLVSHWPGCCVRLALAPGLEDGLAYLYATRACATPCARYRTLASEAGRIGRGHGCHACGGGPFQAHDGRGAGTAPLADARRDPGGRVIARSGRTALRPL